VRGKGKRGSKRQAERHVSGQELCEAARRYGLQQYGFLAPTVLATWGIRRTDDIGEIVFNMIEIGQMRKTKADKREDFRGVFEFDEAFSRDLSFVVPDTV
ncbi:MAG: Minf_1886 family protein, partial [Planctomycetota bacterium]